MPRRNPPNRDELCREGAALPLDRRRPPLFPRLSDEIPELWANLGRVRVESRRSYSALEPTVLGFDAIVREREKILVG